MIKTKKKGEPKLPNLDRPSDDHALAVLLLHVAVALGRCHQETHARDNDDRVVFHPVTGLSQPGLLLGLQRLLRQLVLRRNRARERGHSGAGRRPRHHADHAAEWHGGRGLFAVLHRHGRLG